MSLQVWLPLNGDLHNQGLCNFNPIINTSPTWTNNGKIGKAMMLGSVTMPASAAEQILNNQAFSFACWIYVAATAGSTTDRAMLFGTSGMPANNNRKFSIFQYPTCNDLHLSWMNDAASTTFAGGVWSGIFPTGKWTHLAITYQNPSGKIYINGTQYATFSGTSNSSSFAYDTRLFENCPNNGRYLNDYRIYNHCLSDKEVEEIAKGLILHYKLDQPANINNNLYTGSKEFTGTWVNGSAWTTDTDTYNGFTVKKKSSIWGGLAQNVTAINGDIFTISFWAKIDSGGNILSIHRSSLGNVTTGLTMLDGNFESSTNWINAGTDGTQWQRYWATLQITSTDITYLQWRIENSVADKNLYIAGMTLEKGYGTKNWSLSTAEAGTTDTIYDSSGYNYNGTISNNIELISSPRYQIGSGALNNSNTTITTSINALSNILANGTKYTLACWARPTGTNANGWVIKLGNNQCGLWWAASQARWVWNENDNGKRCANPTISSDYTNWHHLVTTVDKTSVTTIIAKHYVDGEPADGYSSQTWDGSNFNQPSGNNIVFYLQNSDLSDIRLYMTDLTEQQIKELYDTSATIDHEGNIYAREFEENDQLNLTKTGIFGTSNIYDNDELTKASILKTDKQVQGNTLYEY